MSHTTTTVLALDSIASPLHTIEAILGLIEMAMSADQEISMEEAYYLKNVSACGKSLVKELGRRLDEVQIPNKS